MPAVWMPYRKHNASPYAFCMASIHQAYSRAICLQCSMHMASICLNHIGATWIAYMRHIDLHMEITLRAISLPCGIHIIRRMPFLTQPSLFILAWDRHRICWLAYPAYRRHMAKPYVFCMVSIQQAYGKAMCLLCGVNMAAIYG